MLSNKSYIFIAIFIFIASVASYFFSLASSDNRQMNVQLLWQGEKIGCQAAFNAHTGSKTWFIEQLQFFISDVEFHSEHLGWQKAMLNNTAFQANNTVLLGTNCRDTQHKNGARNTDNWAVDFQTTVLMNNASRIRFTLGVPFEVNHLNPIHQPSPLNLSSMFWVWQTGHKFMRIELATNNEQWLFHLGSTGCQSTSVMRPAKQQCRYPNRFTFDLPITEQNDGDLWLNMDLAALLSNVDLSALSSCQSEHDNISCQQLLTNLSVGNINAPVITQSSVFNAIKTKDMNQGTDVE